MQVLLEFPQTVIERVKRRAGILRSSEVPAKTTDFSNQGARSIVFLSHHRDRIRNGAEAATGLRGSIGDRPLQGQRCRETGRLLPSPDVG